MNYNHYNKIHEFVTNKLFPYVTIHADFTVFGDYLTAFSDLPSGKWLRNRKNGILMRNHFAMNAEEFLKDFSKYCISFLTVEAGENKMTYRIIYQYSSEIHLEAFLLIWVERDMVLSCIVANICMKNRDKFPEFLKKLEKYKLTGDSADISPRYGFSPPPK